MNELFKLVDMFSDATIKHHTALTANNHKAANKYFKLAERYVCEIKQYPNWEKSFINLLNHENIGVRINSASILLPYETKLAEQVLKKHCFATGIDGFNARMILKEWKSGDLKFPALENGKVIYR